MKIVLPVHHFPPRYSAGAELYTLRIARRLRTLGHDVEVVCIERVDSGRPGVIDAEQDLYQDVPVWRLGLDLRNAPADWRYHHPLIEAWMRDYLARVMPDLVHLQSGYLITAAPLIAAQECGIPTVVTLHDFWFLCPRVTLLRGDNSLCHSVPADPAACGWCELLTSRRFRLPNQATGGLFGAAMLRFGMHEARTQIAARRRHLTQVLQSVDAAIAPSQFMADAFTTVIAPERMHVVRVSVDTSQLRDLTSPPADGVLRLGYIGQVAPHKGVHVLIRAVRDLPSAGRPVELTIYGGLEQQPDYVAQLRAIIGADPRIRLAGRFENTRIGEVLSQFDATVVPSVWYENSPLAIMEAQAAGRPVLTSNIGGMAELVRDEVDGLHFKVGDVADLSRQIQRLRTEPGLLVRLGAGVPAPMTINEELRRLTAIYRNVVPSAALL